MKRNFIRSLLGVILFAVSATSQAEDIDLFVKSEGTAGDPPNVLLILDNAANFSSATSSGFTTCPGVTGLSSTMSSTNAGLEQCALYKVIEALDPGTVSLGVMMFNANSFFPSCPGGDGGCLVYPMTEMTATNKAAMLDWLKTWVITNGQAPAGALNVKTNNKKNGQAMQEAWAFFAGKKGVSGRDYSAIKPGASCANNYVVFVGNADGSNGTPGDGANNSDDALNGTLTGTNALMNASPAATALQKALITDPVPVSCEGGGSQTLQSGAVQHSSRGHYAAEWARYMSSQNITTYTIGLLGSACKKEYEALLKIMGDEVGGGKYFPTNNFEELKTAFAAALSEIQSVNSVFASVSLPVSVNTQGTYLNQVFVGMFRPDEKAGPRWFGNLKQYKLGYLGNSLKLLDADGAGAISSGESGFISENARSFWTPPTSQTLSTLYWYDLAVANSIGYLPASETPDGNMVEKGGQGYKLRTIAPADRKVLTCADADCGSLGNFDVDNGAITAAALAVTDAERDEVINWARGLNVDAEHIANSTLDGSGYVTKMDAADAELQMRPSSHGDVVHSRPVAINFSTDADPEVVVFYGGNDGILRAVNGNRDGGSAVGGKQPGEELWSFVAPASYGIFSRLKAKTPLISYPNVSGGEPKDYGFDGPVTAYKAASSAWVYASMRRGGRMLYAFDVPDTNPANPTLKWRVGCDDNGCTDSKFSGIGQTWAVPTVIKSAGYAASGVSKPMLIVGGGYDSCEDKNIADCTSSSPGHAIYLLDAETGEELQTFDSSDVADDMGGVIGDITVLKDSAGLATYAYAADLSGNVYRISGTANAPIGSVAPGSWVITKIASLGGTGGSARKFMFGPDVVVDNGVNYIMLGSGDREKPTVDYPDSNAVNNYFFMLKDVPTNSTWLSSENANCSADIICVNSLLAITTSATPAQADIDAKKGWYLQLSTSEQVVTSALTIFGTVYFSTHQPDLGLVEGCSAKLGESRAYAISYKNAEGLDGPRYVDLVGDGLPPSPVAGLVTLDDGTTVPFCIGCGEKPLEGSEPPSPPGAKQPKSRVFWNIEQ
ncbi:pilus assembly protein [Pseudomonas sp. N040]|uniref:pilus assembly protein n=1 Tax=Pseudomonas sp. N040 TaxID=2785325 RepID=UPI0018A2CE63|nr:PilC/PilY family type IV pilus protein [Pseudomonas sp. N040]MBF7730244.1 pilus assembly protein PilY [Pseudomonas sp. N040]MBW7013886.1 pilus assembly protein PilY [Pseudomonas sp. N040]